MPRRTLVLITASRQSMKLGYLQPTFGDNFRSSLHNKYSWVFHNLYRKTCIGDISSYRFIDTDGELLCWYNQHDAMTVCFFPARSLEPLFAFSQSEVSSALSTSLSHSSKSDHKCIQLIRSEHCPEPRPITFKPIMPQMHSANQK